ncbi:hypothetical protein KCU91_g1491, partial [Aureobasidium melanogenum]
MDPDITDSALEDIRFLFHKKPSDPDIIHCWNAVKVHQIMYNNPETVELVSLGDHREPAYTATINKRLLTRLSPYFKALLEGGFSESTMESLPLDSYPHELRMFEQWLSAGIINIEGGWPTYDKLFLYLFADYYDIPALRREAMSSLTKHEEKPPGSFHLIAHVLGFVLSSSPLYKFLVETCTQHFTPQYKAGGYEELTKEFLYDMFLSLANKSASKPCRCCHNPCDYHEHDDEEEWKKNLPNAFSNMEERMTEKTESVSSSDQIQESQTSELQATIKAHLKRQERLEAQLEATRQESRLLQETYDKHIKSIDGPENSLSEAEVERLIQEKGLPLPQESDNLLIHAINEWSRYKNLSEEKEQKITGLLTRICTADAVLELNFPKQLRELYEQMNESSKSNMTHFSQAMKENAALISDLKDSGHAKQIEIVKLEVRLTSEEAMTSRLEDDIAKLKEELNLGREEKKSLQEEIWRLTKKQTESFEKLFAFRRAMREAVDLICGDEISITKRIDEIRGDLAAQDLALESVVDDSNIAKIELLKVARNERDGIYSTLGVSSCLGAHLAIGNLKLAQLDSGILRKAIGDFEDEAAVAEIKRLRRADLELVKVVSALDGVAGDSNVAKIDNLKATSRNE